ncbi:hypothetical protein [Haloarcula montana]|uniref:hypothetical protein n=1 Tax=Haloarcula montana TaxID=3111776 RepID=UPI002D76A087|nr:hypothetical protein [Haloarcula sp. GH36]
MHPGSDSRHAMVPDETTRREALRLAAGSLAAGTGASLSGCTSALPPLGSQLDFGRVDVPDPDEPTYRQWLPAPSRIADDRRHYNVLFRRPTAIDYIAPVRFAVPKKSLLTDLDYVGVDYPEYDRLLSTPFGVVLDGQFDASTVTEALADTGYGREGAYHEYDLFTRSDDPRTVALRDGTVVFASERAHGTPDIRALADAEAGRTDRYHEVSDRFARASTAIGESRMVEFRRPNEARNWLKAEAFRFEGETAYHVVTHHYPDDEAVPTDRLKQRSVQKTLLTREVDAFHYEERGQMATVAGRVPPGEGLDPATEPYPPHAAWGGAVDSGTVTLRHEAGETVDAANLRYELRSPAGTTVQSGAPWSGTETVRAGDTTTVSLDGSTDVARFVLQFTAEGASYGSVFTLETGGDG